MPKILLTIPVVLDNQIKDEAKNLHLPKTGIIRLALSKYFKKKTSS